MEDIVGIKVTDKIYGTVGFITWGRVLDRIDEVPLLQAIQANLSKFGILNPESIMICQTLQELSHSPYFYEALFAFSQEKIGYGKHYESWCAKKEAAILAGEDIYFLGISQGAGVERKPGSISHGFYVKI